MTLAQGIFDPPVVGLVATLSFPGILTAPATVEQIEKHAGSAAGSCVVSFRANAASVGLIGYGKEARVTLGGQTVFRGTVGAAPIEISSDRDQVQVILYDDKWGMSSMVIGQSGIGTLAGTDKGFPDVGHEIIFNKDGLPNKDPAARNFKRGTGAVFWRLHEIMLFIFDNYIPSAVATCTSSELDGSYERVPSHVVLSGMTGLQAVQHIADLAGQSWGLEAHVSASKFKAVKRGGGTTRQARFFVPGAGGSIATASEWHVSAARVSGSVLNCRDVHQARSGNIVIEHTYTSTGTDPLLTRLAGFLDKKFAARYVTDISKYSAHQLGVDLTAGTPAKAWWSNLVTRLKLDGSGYVTAAEIASAPQLASQTPIEIPVWIRQDTTDAASVRQLAVGGYEIDYEYGLIDFESKVEVLSNAGVKSEITITDWSKVGVWITVATVLETSQFETSSDNSEYLEDPFYVVIDKTDLVPERRLLCELPDLSVTDNSNAVASLAPALENYVDVTDELQAAADSSGEASPELETPISLDFAYFPIAEVGDALRLLDRDLGETGDEVITSVVYNVHEQFTTHVEATNVVVGISPEQFIKQ